MDLAIRTFFMSAIEQIKKVKKFTDISLAFEPNPINGDLSVLKDDRAIQNSIKNIVMTTPKEAGFNMDFGSTITDLLFDFQDEDTKVLLEMEIRRAIIFNEPRVDDLKVEVYPSIDQYAIVASIQYKIVGLDKIITFDQILTPTG